LTTSIGSGSGSVSFYFRDSQSGLVTITAAAQGKASATQAMTIAAEADTTAPETTLTAAPSGTVAASSVTISFAANEPGVSFECSLDGGPFAACASPATYAGLLDGTHSFDVRAIDSAGNTDGSPARASWTSDTVAPETFITGAPAPTAGTSAATFHFSASEPASFACRLDGGAWSACTSPQLYELLGAGPHSLEIRASDSAGNTDPTPAIHSWTITSPPISSGGGGGGSAAAGAVTQAVGAPLTPPPVIAAPTPAVIPVVAAPSRPATARLTIEIKGRGSVTRTPARTRYQPNTTITLKARPKPGWRFSRWAGACRGTRAICKLKLTRSTSVSAQFRRVGNRAARGTERPPTRLGRG
jgi:hypothetical protein